MESLLPRGRSENFELTPKKGYYYSQPLVAWAAIEDCTAELCRIMHLCMYKKSTATSTAKCGLQRVYIQATAEMIHRCFEKELQGDENLLFRVGMHLMPLYKTLCKLKMEELSVTYPVYATPRGDRKADPVYKELRETIKIIDMTYRNLGLKGASAPSLSPPKGVSYGYEDELFEEEPEKPKLDLGDSDD